MDRKQIKQDIINNLKIKDVDVVEKVKLELDDLENTSGMNDKNALEEFWSLYQTYKDQIGDKNDGNSWAMWALGLVSVKPEEDPGFSCGHKWMPERRTYARVGFPDIDIDFDASRRHEVFEAIEQDVGSDFFAHLGTNQTLQMRETITRLVKAGDLANAWFKGEDEWVKQNIRLVREVIDQFPKRKGKLKGKNEEGKEIEIKTVEDAYQCFQNFRFYMDKFPFIRKHAKNMEGLVRGFGVHAAGIVLSPEPIGELAPLMKANIFGTQYVAEDIESMGFIKIDILGLAALTTIDKTVKLIKSRYDIDIDADNIDVSDESTLELYRTGKLNGVFQCEEKMMQSTLKDIGVDSFDDVMAAIALYRPGPMDNIPSYCNRKRGFEEPNYFHPNIKKATENILNYTYGLPIYQEQIMQICESLAGFTPVEGYEVIKGIGKKKEELIKKYRDQFINSRKFNAVDGEVLEEYWDTFIQKFAGYGFNLCLSGKTYLKLPNGDRIHLSKAYKKGIKEIMSMWSDGSIRPHKINKITKTGKKKLYKIKTIKNNTLKLTSEHRLLTTEGYKPLSDFVVGKTELIVFPKKTTSLQREARCNSMVLLNKSDLQRKKASVRLSNVQRGKSSDDLIKNIKKWQLANPEKLRLNMKAAKLRVDWLMKNDPEWKKRFIEKTLANVRSCYDTGPGFGKCSISSNGMWCASTHERNMCEFLISQGIDFEMHKVLKNGRVCDFYFSGLYWEMDGMDRNIQYFKDKYGDLPFQVVTPEDYKMIINKTLTGDNVENGDLVVSIEEIGEEETYDIEMEKDGPLNFVANQFISHNSHSGCYGYLSFVTAFLKKHYTEEFFAGLLNTFNDMKKHDKIEKYLADLEDFDIQLGERKINKCGVDFEIVQKKDVSLGIMKSVISPSLMCKGVGPNSAIDLAGHKPYKDLRDVATKTSSRYVNKETIASLIDSGFFDSYMKQYSKTHRKKLTKEAIISNFEQLRNDVGKFASKGITYQNLFGMTK